MKKILLFFLILLIFSYVNCQDAKVETPIRPETVGSSTDSVTDDSAKITRDAVENGEKHAFQAEINQLLGIIINSLYTDKEIFLRELISNASDALDKIRFLSLTDDKALKETDQLEIRVKADPKARTITITDTGIGMTKKDLMTNLGTIAKSGTKAFLEKIKSSSDLSMIGQFGVGFYSAFIIADRVTVISKNNEDDQYIWTSSSDNSFSIMKDPRGNTLKRGTEIVLYLKNKTGDPFLKEDKLKGLIHKYSEFTHFPILLYTIKKEKKQVPVEEEKEEKKEEEKKEEEKKEGEEKVDVKETPKEKKTKEIEVEREEWEKINEIQPIWTRNPKKISEEEYNGFYKAISKEFDNPLAYTHFKAEGSVDFKSILYIPGKSPSDLFNFDKQVQGLQLFVKKVFITDRMKEYIPRYLNFIKGVIDSEDLPLHISRQDLQRSSYLNMIKNKVIGRILKLLKDLAEEEIEEKKEPAEGEKPKDRKKRYSKFWTEFGKNIRLGIVEDTKNRKELIELLRYYSTHNETELSSLKDYISRMKTNQKHIYYITGESIELAKKSPFIEQCYERGFEVLYFVDTIDEYILQHLADYEGKKLVSVNKEGLEFGDEDNSKDEKEKEQKKFEKLTQFLTTQLKDKNINQVKISNRLKNSPCVIVSTATGVSANMERILKAQALAGGNNPQIEYMLKQPKVFEINPTHPVIVELNERVSNNDKDLSAIEITQLLYDTASLRSGYSIDNSDLFADRIFDLMKKSLDKLKRNDNKQQTESKDEL